MSGMVIPRTYGRLGNFLFQAACTIGYSLKHGMPFTLPSTTKDAKWNPIYLQHLVDKDFDPSLISVPIHEKEFTYQVLPFKEEWRNRNIILDGYWQSEKYFKDFRTDVLRMFGFDWRMLEGFCSVHVRRGDYLTIKKGGQFKHPPVSAAWIENAMAQFPGHRFRFFSDDIDWCMSHFAHRRDCSFPGGLNEVLDLVHMSWGQHQICSASTFSWWAAWLNQNPKKRIVMPKHWLSPGWGGIDTSDIVPVEWERL